MRKPIFFVTIFFIFSIFIIFQSYPVWAAWTDASTVNKAVATEGDDQTDPAILSDGSGGAIIVWEDRRGESTDIYAQRVDTDGAILWAEKGEPIAKIDGISHSKPAIASDGSGGAIITWQDSRDGSTDIYAQRVDANGNVLWTVNGVQISAANGANTAPAIGSDGSGGAIITYQTSLYNPENEPGSRYTYSIYAQRVDANGNVLWTSDAAISAGQPNNHYKLRPTIVSDGSGGAIIAWYDNRQAAERGIDIYAQRVNANGSTQWTINGLPISIANEDQLSPKIATDGSGGAIIIWLDARDGYYDVYAQRVDADGNRLWLNSAPDSGYEGIPVSTAAHFQEDPEIVSDGSGGAIITWDGDYDGTGEGNGGFDIYAQRVDADGNMLWMADGIPISAADYDQNDPRIVSDGSGGAIITWQDARSEAFDVDEEGEGGDGEPLRSQRAGVYTGYDIYAQRVDADGNMLWTADGVPISTAVEDQESPVIAADGAGGAVIAWPDRRSGIYEYDIYAQRVYYNGALTDSDGDGVPDNVDDSPNDSTIATPLAVTGTGKITVDSSVGTTLSNVQTISDSDTIQTGKPADHTFPDGLVAFRVNSVAPGGEAVVVITFPTTIPEGAKYYKVDSSGYYEFENAVISGNTVTLTLTDTGDRDGGDSNGVAGDGVITDPGGVAVPTNPVVPQTGGGSGPDCFIKSLFNSPGL